MVTINDSMIRFITSYPLEKDREVVKSLLDDTDSIDLASYTAKLAYQLYRVKLLFEYSPLHWLDETKLTSDYVSFKNAALEACDIVFNVFKLSMAGRRSEALECLYSFYFASGLIDKNIETISDRTKFYRMRPSENYQLYSEDEMFHVPFEACYKTTNYRYSISGLPILYFCSSLYGCWMECNQPNIEKANVALYVKEADVKCIDMMMPKRNDKITKQMLQFLPLLLACNIEVQRPDEPFKPEYVIPQLFTDCTLKYCSEQKMNYILGIKYLSTKWKDEHNFFSGKSFEGLHINYAFPPKTYHFSGVCPKLKEAFHKVRITSLFYETHVQPSIDLIPKKDKTKTSYRHTTFSKLESWLEDTMLRY